MAHGSSLVGHINASHVLTVHTYCHMLGAKTSPENPSSHLFPNISCFTEDGSESQQVGNTFCNHMFAVTLFTYSEVLSSVGFIPTFAVSYRNKHGVAKSVSNFLACTVVPLAPSLDNLRAPLPTALASSGGLAALLVLREPAVSFSERPSALGLACKGGPCLDESLGFYQSDLQCREG